jgi:hypothetical protein
VIKQNLDKVSSVICSTLWYFFTCAGVGKGRVEVKEGENMVSLRDLLTLISPSVYLIQPAASSAWREWNESSDK